MLCPCSNRRFVPEADQTFDDDDPKGAWINLEMRRQ